MKEEQSFVELRKKQKAFKAHDERESRKFEIHLNVSPASPATNHCFGRGITITTTYIDFDSPLRPAEWTRSAKTFLSYPNDWLRWETLSGLVLNTRLLLLFYECGVDSERPGAPRKTGSPVGGR